MIKLYFSEGNVSHRTAIIDAVDEFNQNQQSNISVFIGTKIIIKNLLNLNLFRFQGKIVVFYFTGLGRLYTDYGVYGKFAFMVFICILGFWKKSYIFVENKSDTWLLKKIFPRKIYQINGSGLFTPFSANKVFVCKKSKKNLKEIIFVSRFGKSKCTDQIIDLAQNLPQNVNLTIVGTDISWTHYSKTFSQLSKEYSNISYLGWIDEADKIYKLIKQSDILIYPSLREGCPFAVLESISQGTLPILSNTPGSSDLANDLGLPTLAPNCFKDYAILDAEYKNFFNRRKLEKVYINNFDKYSYKSVKKEFIEIFYELSQ